MPRPRVPGLVGPRIRGAGARTLTALFNGLLTSRFDADYYAIDGGTGRVSDWIDYLDPTHTLHQGAVAQQALVPAPNALFANANTTVFGSGTFTLYDSTRAAASWTGLHGGNTGGSWLHVHRQNATALAWRCLAATTTAANRGHVVYAQTGAAAASREWDIWSGPAVVVLASIVASAPHTNPTYLAGWVNAAAYAWYLKAALLAGGVPGAPSSLAPTITLRLGAVTAGFGGFTGDWRGSYFNASRPWTVDEYTSIIQPYVQATTGIAP